MPPVTMETILRLLDYPNMAQYCWDYPSIVCWGGTNSLGGVFVERKIRSDNANKLWAMLCKTFLHKVWISWYKMSRQSVKSLLNHFVSVAKMSYLISTEAP